MRYDERISTLRRSRNNSQTIVFTDIRQQSDIKSFCNRHNQVTQSQTKMRFGVSILSCFDTRPSVKHLNAYFLHFESTLTIGNQQMNLVEIKHMSRTRSPPKVCYFDYKGNSRMISIDYTSVLESNRLDTAGSDNTRACSLQKTGNPLRKH